MPTANPARTGVEEDLSTITHLISTPLLFLSLRVFYVQNILIFARFDDIIALLMYLLVLVLWCQMHIMKVICESKLKLATRTTIFGVLALLLFSAFPSNLFDIRTRNPLHINGTNYLFAPSWAGGSDVPVDIDYKCPVGVTNRPELPQYCEIELPLNGSSFTLRFKLGGTIYDTTLDPLRKTLTINFTEAFSKGIHLILPRELIDARSGNTDSNFTIMLDGKNISYTELNNNSTTRELLIPTTRGDHFVQIMGTYVVPEFPSMMILVLSLVMILAMFTISKRLGKFDLIRRQ